MDERTATDDTGRSIDLPDQVTRIVSLVPSLTEAIAESAPERLIGATDWCTHPADLAVPRLGGTKNPHVAAVVALEPDVVLVAVEENRAEDVAALRAAGVTVWTTDIRDVASALESLDRMLWRFGVPKPGWLAAAQAAWAEPPPAIRRRVAVPIWRRPWMVAGADTFTTDVLARMGLDNVFDDPPADMTERYPKATPAEMVARGAELVILPDEPYVFTASDGPESFAGLDVALVSGRQLTWYGPSMATARSDLAAAIENARPGEAWAGA
ncbi:MAG: helical backbone metal receptor [Sporichthyaceae bacterium]